MAYQTMDVRPIAGSLGAEIYGVDLKDRDDSPMWQELRQAFLDYHVIAVRGQDMSPAALSGLAASSASRRSTHSLRAWTGFRT